MKAYETALQKGRFEDEEIAAATGADLGAVEEVRKSLQDLHLLSQPAPGRPVVPLDPEVAEAELVTPLEVEIGRRRREIGRIHEELRTLAADYRARPSGGPAADVPITVLDDVEEVRREIDRARYGCTEERMSLQSGGGRPPELLEADREHTLELLRRGVRVRTLYQHTARTSLATRTYVQEVTRQGAEVRTVDELSERLIIYDRRIAFIPKERTGSRPPGAAVITEPTVVGYLARSFESVWQIGRPFEVGRQTAEHPQVAEEVRHSIIRLMALGLKDEVIARRLGMATRTCRRHISAIMEEMGAVSRFQAGLIIGRENGDVGS
ncbi:LuxR C-terminal-related transcriptional regulator [Streptomyces cylindrosporus]|uniref:LuxR C-terminal-related transcriptional regulator n=1 Tax=Streptomyces cylindrosporus TaxID=2927583 RepID=A0ABS9YEM5_9ACTN|nr:LuxR C-terminal-related transcriptional regulator [Streptomyces cylindrosporus]MCI3275682.1 LuxR C-terminal-related transcriptional regulator [Streptomyces cylindrosporus]